MNTNQTKTFLVTRPTLANLLINEGIPCQITTNPYKQNYKAWTVTLDTDSARIIKGFYESIGRPIPSVVSDLMRKVVC